MLYSIAMGTEILMSSVISLGKKNSPLSIGTLCTLSKTITENCWKVKHTGLAIGPCDNYFLVVSSVWFACASAAACFFLILPMSAIV